MRISTLTIFERNTSSLNRQQSDFLKVGQQFATGKRVINPSDDPQAASRAVGVGQAKAITQQYMDARITARNALAQEESVLNSISDAVISAKTLLVQGANGTLSDADRSSVAAELKSIYETLYGQANVTDGNGRYLFAGYQDNSAPFIKDAAGKVSYVGGNTAREQRVDASRLMPVADNGNTVFRSVHSSAGYIAEAAADNAGTLTFSGPLVLNSSDANYGASFTLSFTENADGSYSYSTDGGASLLTYEPGQPIEFAGLSLTLEGIPADGDSIQLGTAQNMNPDLFASLEKAIAVLDTAVAGDPKQQAQLDNTLKTVMRELDNSLDNVLTVRASVGARLNELDVIDTVAGNRMLNYEQTLSDLLDLDYVQAAAEYSLRMVGLQAAQKSFVDIQGMTLFNYLN
ncbi:flagellar hook-associated protein FlgL [Denitrificimonas sp. JX-1]|uniref:Flagellar hook-associated protein FlgL n=1 Tax=Denitrificimonas halotolerans TaxID=3098930 RepID=A0ABU5GT59_9GAMM|nr:flagellar hook-associated protein FlgL [Denitrificimonas sp. JX-1]MDY7219692.1 flagellar hook-associated protein FlgL [Denitrificimonas sp. JX-1]